MKWKGVKKEFQNEQINDIRYLIAINNKFTPNTDYKDDLNSIIQSNPNKGINLN